MGMPVERAWVVSLGQRLQETVWLGRMYMPDALVSQIVLDAGKLLSVEAQYVDQSFARRLRLVERDVAGGRLVRELPFSWHVPEGHEACRLLNVAGRWHVAHEPWKDAPSSSGILLPWPAAADSGPPPDVVSTSLLPAEMARQIDDARCMAADGNCILVAAVLGGRSAPDTRRWLAVALIEVEQQNVRWRARAEIAFPVERHRGGVRVGRFGHVVVGRVSTTRPTGPRRCQEFFAALEADTGRPLWSRAAPPRRQPPAFELVGDARRLYVHTEDAAIEAWEITSGKVVWRMDVGKTIAADGLIEQDELMTFIGDDYPTPATSTLLQPAALPISGLGRMRTWRGAVGAVLPPSFAVVNQWVLSAPDDRLLAWPLVGQGEPLTWKCWRLPGGLLPQDAASEMFRLDANHVATYMRGTGTLTLFRTGAAF
jgi:hypothetical protein